MAKSKKTDIRELNDSQIQAQVAELEASISKLKFEHAVKGLQNPLEIRETRRQIAKLHTEIRSRELQAASPEVLAKRTKIRLRRRLK